ncbi:hypothetical protein [Butyrivibrio sp. FC2001]|uniref:hypothetical protein n=1 Tax=Butyrivibrio sp. FC2001 TaxID=1280671 RepID=UPI0004091E22|nr:hypothetical protein [Butyrivibrio sp. FC2001]
MNKYSIYGLNILSDYEFEEAFPIDNVDEADVIIQEAEKEEKFRIPELEDREKGYYYCHDRLYSWIKYPKFGEFVILEGKLIKYKLYDGYNRMYVNEIFLCLVIPILLVQRNQIMLHGSGLVYDDKCFVVSGRSGAGKSTITNAFIKAGAKFLADDTVALTIEEAIYANSAYPQQKLCFDQISEDIKKECELVLLPEDDGEPKYAVRSKERFYFGQKRLDAFIVLNPSDKVEEPIIEEVNGAEKISLLMDNFYSYDAYKDMGLPAEIFKACLYAVSKIKIYRLSRPKKGMTTEKQLELIKNVL